MGHPPARAFALAPPAGVPLQQQRPRSAFWGAPLAGIRWYHLVSVARIGTVLRLEPEKHRRLKAVLAREGKSMQWIWDDYVDRYLEKREGRVAASEPVTPSPVARDFRPDFKR